jgi:hypothetical protein
MKNKILFILAIMTVGMTSCLDDFLEKPDTSGNIDLEKVYSSSVTAEQTLAAAYRQVLLHGLPGGCGFYHGTLGCISGERAKGANWWATWEICDGGLKVSNVLNASSGTAGADDLSASWAAIRTAYLVKENIDRVPEDEMTQQLKDYIKAEATALIAYRYMGMFYRFGGLPLVKKSLLADDEDMYAGRSTLKETFDFITGLCDEAIAGLPEKWETKYTGRMTKGAALAIKARVLQFAARPLFNSATPYLHGEGADELVCFGNADPSRWQDAINVHEAVLTWAAANGCELINTGGTGVGQPNPNARDDYGTACSYPGNKEVILAYKIDANDNSNLIFVWNNTSVYGERGWEVMYTGLPTNMLEYYYAADGTELSWPKIGDAAATPAQVWYDNIDKIEPRFAVDHNAPYTTAPSISPGDALWRENWYRTPANIANFGSFPGIHRQYFGAAITTKFYYNAGSRVWFEPPLFRLAETYLSLAEAYNETGNSTKALENLNKVHNRAGLPSITETNKDKLREIIWREKSLEFIGENHRYFDVKHWKHPRIDQGIIGGQIRELQFVSDTDAQPDMWVRPHLVSFWDANSYVCYWHPKMYLEPFSQSEINKGYMIQNPGY